MIDNITGIILAGGRSRRIGKDKAFLPIDNEPMIQKELKIFQQVFSKIIVVTNTPDKYKHFEGIKIITDIIPECGPLGGIYSGLSLSDTEYSFFAACDMPFINKDMVFYIINQLDGVWAVVPFYGGKTQPLFAAYSKECLLSIEKQLSLKKFAIKEYLKGIIVKFIQENELKDFDNDGRSFVNINTIKDYDSYGNA